MEWGSGEQAGGYWAVLNGSWIVVLSPVVSRIALSSERPILTSRFARPCLTSFVGL